MLGLLCVGNREARADCQCGELIDRIAASAPVRELLFVELRGHTRVPFAGYRPDHRAGIGSKYVILRGGLRRAIPFLLVRSGVRKSPILCGMKRSCLYLYCLAKS